jgi:hypothetical protein
MAEIKSLKQASDKWVRRASVAGADYQAGVANPRRSWSEASVAGEANYKAGVIKAAGAGMYGKGIKAVGEAKWKDRATKLGPGRFAEGVSVAVDDWQKGFSPYHAAISAIKLPDRGPKGDPKNIQRVSAIATALRAVKEKG